jgi:hypothetical protein
MFSTLILQTVKRFPHNDTTPYFDIYFIQNKYLLTHPEEIVVLMRYRQKISITRS